MLLDLISFINSSIIDEKYAADFESRVVEKWTGELDEVRLKDYQFWIENRRFIQNDKQFKFNLYRRVVQWDQTIDQLSNFENELKDVLNSLDSLNLVVDEKINLFYWEL